ncbi:type I restriction-modification system methyltransferase subunit [Burkholderia sp. YI23]|nr:type I restriction-modification system methyltransferase subunit [Burkholderia sp. YI23]
MNASSEGNFEKGKRQNRLLPEHIDKIVSTYQYRRELPRYSRRVSMVEIEKSDFNLNIARYVSTAAVQEKIDLHALSLELKGIAENSTKAAKTHNTFLKELGLPPV